MSKNELEAAFTPAFIGKMELENRFIRSATWDGMAGENGEVTPKQINLYKTLAAGGTAGCPFLQLKWAILRAYCRMSGTFSS